MKLRLTIFAKIVLWFFLNLALVVAAGWIVIRVQVKWGVDSFLGGYVGRRLEPLARKVVAELESSPRSDWDSILAKAGAAHRVQFYITGMPRLFTGGTNPLPESVVRRLPAHPSRPPPGFGPPPGLQNPGPPPDRELPKEMQDFSDAAWQRQTERQDPTQPLPVHERFFLHSDNPRAYWAGLLLPIRNRNGRGFMPAGILARSDTFSAGGLFFDYKPWMLLGGGMVLLSVLLWLPLVRDLTHTIRHLTHATRQVADGQFDVRANEERGDELGQLGGSVNRMTERLEGFVKGQKHFLGAIAHELCSPLARLQMALGILEQHTDEKQAPHLEDLREEVQHMSDLVNELLSFSKASLKPSEVKLASVNIKAVIEAAARREAADAGEVRLRVPDNLHAQANAELVQRALANLVRNSLRYAGEAGPVEVSARSEGNWVEISVADRGPGIPEEHLENAFEMFYRVEADRARDTGGVGLGLAIVRQCIEVCGGTVTAQNRRRGGLRVTIQLRPASPTESA